jgi:hypothetical protein
MTNTVHSVGTLSIATAERALVLSPSPEHRPAADDLLRSVADKMRPRILTDSQLINGSGVVVLN